MRRAFILSTLLALLALGVVAANHERRIDANAHAIHGAGELQADLGRLLVRIEAIVMKLEQEVDDGQRD